MSIKESVQEKFLFLNKFLHAPGQIGSVTPSSGFLARKMLESVPWHEVGAMAELGSGTGAITKYIPYYAGRTTQVLLFEADGAMRQKTAELYPQFSCYSDTGELQLALQKEAIDRLDCIVSGLPFFNFTQAMRNRLMEQILGALKERGWFIAFQYSQQMKKQLSEHFEIVAIKWVPLNIPPAFVYVCRKKTADLWYDKRNCH